MDFDHDRLDDGRFSFFKRIACSFSGLCSRDTVCDQSGVCPVLAPDK